MATKTDGIRVVRDAFWDGNTFYRAGTTVRAGHPIVKRFSENFCDEDYVDIEWPKVGE